MIALILIQLLLLPLLISWGTYLKASFRNYSLRESSEERSPSNVIQDLFFSRVPYMFTQSRLCYLNEHSSHVGFVLHWLFSPKSILVPVFVSEGRNEPSHLMLFAHSPGRLSQMSVLQLQHQCKSS